MRTNTKSNVRPIGHAPADIAPRHAIVSRGLAVPAARTPHRPGRERSLAVRVGKRLRGVLDRLIAASSLVANDPVLDMRDFAWTAALRANWRAIRDEALGVALRSESTRSLRTSFFLWGHGASIDGNIARCPATAALVRQIPGLDTALFSILAPGAHIPGRRGVTKGLITCHLGLIVPRDGDLRMRIGQRVVRWAEGETLVYDDTYDHEMWNDSSGRHVVLLLQFARPLRNPGKAIATWVLQAVRRSAFIQEACDNGLIGHETVKQMDV